MKSKIIFFVVSTILVISSIIVYFKMNNDRDTNPKLNAIEKIRGEVPGIGDTVVFKGNGIDLPKKD
jgi:hypothetical protein